MKFSDDQMAQLNDIFDKKLKPLHQDIGILKRDVKSMKKDLNWVIGKYDSRLNHLEKHSSHPPGRISG